MSVKLNNYDFMSDCSGIKGSFGIEFCLKGSTVFILIQRFCKKLSW